MRRTHACAVAAIVFACAGLAAQAPGDTAGRSLPAVIPIFPLEVPTLFPGVPRPLYIFEPRYRAMVADALEGDRIIGMVTLRPGFEADYAGRPPVYEIGCAGIITEYEELPGGRYRIELRGLVKFRIMSEDHTRAYRLARVEAVPENLTPAEREALGAMRRKLEAAITEGGSAKVAPGTTDEELVNMVAQYLPVDPAERQSLLELENPLVRGRALLDLIRAGHPSLRRNVLMPTPTAPGLAYAN